MVGAIVGVSVGLGDGDNIGADVAGEVGVVAEVGVEVDVVATVGVEVGVVMMPSPSILKVPGVTDTGISL